MQDILASENTIKLDIPVRLQWENDNGYCGETATQSCYLYYGSYVSQLIARYIAGSELLIGDNDLPAFDKMKLTYQSWDIQQKKPQYKNHLQWIKKHLKDGHPVIITGYEPKGKNDEYDHIFLAIGANSDNFQVYSDQDYLIYTDHFSSDYVVTKFGQIWDTRAMSGNGQNLDFALPKDVNYGVAITGIQDPSNIFFPIRLEIQENSEPNVSVGKQPVMFSAKITISELQQGTKYVLLRYDHFKNIPTTQVKQNKAQKVVRFVAESDQHILQDQFMSNTSAFYRCVEQSDLQ